ncbi:hypothetical protein GS870_24945 [Rhodococcus hoagii]|nr:hypothetical protein [Prescottella equi]
MSAHRSAAAGRASATWSLSTEELKRRLDGMFADVHRPEDVGEHAVEAALELFGAQRPGRRGAACGGRAVCTHVWSSFLLTRPTRCGARPLGSLPRFGRPVGGVHPSAADAAWSDISVSLFFACIWKL